MNPQKPKKDFARSPLGSIAFLASNALKIRSVASAP
jgi:hypothetical protein